ncbi:MAG: efflux RND transporter permease subunit [bacterium]|nr:efflux RND transporter permease subunit [bacterium]
MLASTSSVVVFTPIAFMSGVIGRIFLQFGLTVVYATMFSLVVSFTLVPMLAARMIRPGQGVGHGEGLGARLARGWNRAYDGLAAACGRSLAWSLDRKWVPLAVTSLVLVGSLMLFRFVGGEFIPTTDPGPVQELIGHPRARACPVPARWPTAWHIPLPAPTPRWKA